MNSRNAVPAVLAIGLGIFTGYYTFQPALKSLQSDKEAKKAQQDRVSAETARKDPSEHPITVQDPGAPPRNTWTERIWGSKETAEVASPDAGIRNDRGDNQR